MSKKCFGCGAILQTNDTKKNGYIPKEKINDANYCERCFKITHYNEKLIVPLKGINDYIITEVNNNKIHSFFLIDFLNINNETINTYKTIKTPKTLVISKLDIIPKSIKKSLITEWIKSEYNIDENIIFISTKKNINTKSIYKILEEQNLKESYILGYTNAGKSTLINKLSIDNNLTNNVITTSLIPNTTLDFIYIKLNDKLTIIDSPGFTLDKNLYNDNEIDLINRLNPKNFLKPRTYQTKENTSLIIENKIKIKPNNINSFTFYVSNNINIEKVFEKNTFLQKKPFNTIEIPENSDLVIKGIGFINIKKACKLEIHTDYIDLIEIRNSMF